MSFSLHTQKYLIACVFALYAANAEAVYTPFKFDADVGSTVSANGNGTWSYNYTLINKTTCGQWAQWNPIECNDWESTAISLELPYYSDSGISDIKSPDGWIWTINSEASSYWAKSAFNNSQAIVWKPADDFSGVTLGTSLSGFGYTAGYSGGKGPFNVDFWNMYGGLIGDPAIPMSPAAIAAGIDTPFAPTPAIPEPSSWALILLGLGGLATVKRRAGVKKKTG